MSFEDRIREALRARAARVDEDQGPAWERLTSADTSARDARSLPIASGWRRAAVFVTAFAVFAAAGGFAWIALRPMGRPGQSSGRTPSPAPSAPGGLATYVNPMGIPITMDYPSAWFAQSVSQSNLLYGGEQLGVVIANTPQAMPSPRAASPSPGPLPGNLLPPDYVQLVVLTRGNPHPVIGAVDSSLPLSMKNAKVAPGPENARVLDATLAGYRLTIAVFADPQASAADLAAADHIVASIRLSNAGPSPAPASPPPPGLTGTLIFATGGQGPNELFSYDLTNGTTTDLGPGSDPAVSPDGTRISFRSGSADQPGGNPTQIGIMNIDGTNVHRLNLPFSIGGESGAPGAPVWSPDGTRIAFATLRGIYIVGIDGRGLHQVSHYPSTGLACYDLEPAWTPDGSSIFFAVRCDGGNEGIWSVHVDGTNRQLEFVTSPGGGVVDFRYPSWSPDGRSLAYEGVTKDHGYAYDTYVTASHPQGAVVTHITHPSPCEQPVWSPDGNWIACVTGQIGLVRANGRDPITLTPVPGGLVGSVAWVAGS